MNFKEQFKTDQKSLKKQKYFVKNSYSTVTKSHHMHIYFLFAKYMSYATFYAKTALKVSPAFCYQLFKHKRQGRSVSYDLCKAQSQQTD